MSLVRLIPVAIAPFLIACGGTPFAPPDDAVIGRFGGPRTVLTAGEHIVQVISTCSFAFFKGPIVPDASGAFVLTRPIRSVANSSLDLEVRGRIVGDQMQVTFITSSPRGETSEQFTLTRGSDGDFSGFACVAALGPNEHRS